MVTTRSASKAGSPAPNLWYHAPDRLTLIWFAVSLPLVIWDTIYVLGRPHTMEGGFREFILVRARERGSDKPLASSLAPLCSVQAVR